MKYEYRLGTTDLLTSIKEIFLKTLLKKFKNKTDLN